MSTHPIKVTGVLFLNVVRNNVKLFIKHTGLMIGINQGYCWVWKLWFENEEARDAFHAQLPPNHPIITGDITPSNRAWLNDFPPAECTMEELETPDVSRIRLSDLGGAAVPSSQK